VRVAPLRGGASRLAWDRPRDHRADAVIEAFLKTAQFKRVYLRTVAGRRRWPLSARALPSWSRAAAQVPRNRPDTVGEFKSVEIGVPHMPAWKAKTRGKLTRESVLLEP
jgi:hypothetical protein